MSDKQELCNNTKNNQTHYRLEGGHDDHTTTATSKFTTFE